MLFCSAFAVIVAMTTLSSFGGAVERELNVHEALSGVSAVADATSRTAVDLPSCIVMALVFALPLDGFTASPVGAGALICLFFFSGWAYSSLGYLLSMLTPSSGPVSTAAAAFALANFAAGCFGFHPKDIVDDPGLSEGGYGIFTVLPGFWSFYALVMSWATASPFGKRRTVLLKMLQRDGYLPGTLVR